MALDRKQKILIPLIVLAFVYVVWQVFDMFGGELTSSKPETTKTSKAALPSVPKVTTTTQVTKTPAATTSETKIQPITPAPQQPAIAPIAPASTQPVANTTTQATSAPSVQPVAVAPTQVTTTVATTTTQPAPQAPPAQPVPQLPPQPVMTAEQANYLRLMQQYQMLKVERLIVEEQAAIAGAKERIARINETAMKYGGDTGVSASLSQPMNAEAGGYRLMYIDFQKGRWTATLNKAGQYMEVTEDTTLIDGSRVLAIDQQGVTLAQGDKKYYLTFYGAMALPSDSPLYSPSPVKAATPVAPIPTSMPTAPPAEQLPTNSVAPTAPENTMAPTGPASKTNGISSVGNTNKTVASAAPKQNPTKNTQLAAAQAPAAPQPAAVKPVQTTPATPKVEQPVVQKNVPKQSAVVADNQTKANTKQNVAPTVQPVAPTTPQVNKTTDTLAQNENKTPAPPVQISNAYTEAEQALLNLPTHYFTIQVRSGSEKDQLIKFAKENKLNNATIFVTLYHKKPWYILTYGTFENYELAQQAVKQMPATVKDLHPWVRPIVTVQNAVKEFHTRG